MARRTSTLSVARRRGNHPLNCASQDFFAFHMMSSFGIWRSVKVLSITTWRHEHMLLVTCLVAAFSLMHSLHLRLG
jgi:hypothetical protein